MAAMSANIRITFDNATEAQSFRLPPEFAAALTNGKNYKCDTGPDDLVLCGWEDGLSINFNRDDFTTTIAPTPNHPNHPIRII